MMGIKYRYILLVMLLFGCATTPPAEAPVPPTAPFISSATSANIAIHKHLWDKETGKCWVCGIGFSPMGGETKTVRLNKDVKQIFIQAIMIEGSFTESEAVVLWEKYKNYKNPDIKGFSNYLIELNPFQKIDKVYIDFVERVKARTIILKKEESEKRYKGF